MTVLKRKTPATSPASAGNAPVKPFTPPKAVVPPKLPPKPPTPPMKAPAPPTAKANPPAPPTKAPAPPKPPAPLKVELPKPNKEEDTRDKTEAPKNKTPKQPSVPRTSGTGKEAPKLAVPDQQPADSGGLGLPPTRPPKKFTDPFTEKDGQLTRLEMLKLSLTARMELWKKLNEDAPYNDFVTILQSDALPKGVIQQKPPGAKPPTKDALWCPYCGDWQKFRLFSYTGYNKCTGCGISDRDYHTRMENNLWNKE